MSKKHRKIGQGQIQGHPKVVDPDQIWFHLKGFEKLCLKTKFEVPSVRGSEVMPMSNLQKYAQTHKPDTKYNTTLMVTQKDKNHTCQDRHICSASETVEKVKLR